MPLINGVIFMLPCFVRGIGVSGLHLSKDNVQFPFSAVNKCAVGRELSPGLLTRVRQPNGQSVNLSMISYNITTDPARIVTRMNQPFGIKLAGSAQMARIKDRRLRGACSI